MELSVLREAKQGSPFKPFTLRLVDGREFLIRHPDFIGLPNMGRRVIVHLSTEDAYEVVDPLLIVSIGFGETNRE